MQVALPRHRVVWAVSSLSGAAALIFETLWFREASRTFGSSVWASSLVLAAFMGGLALGSGLAARHRARIRRPFIAYAAVEGAIAVTGLLLCLALPSLEGVLAPLFSPLLERPLLLNTARAALAFNLMLIPATGMGATLPLLIEILSRRVDEYGTALGQLYGFNTLGAVLGAVGVETVLVPTLGLRLSALVAAGFNAAAAGLAFAALRVDEAPPSPSPDASGQVPTAPTPVRFSGRAGALLAAAGLAGGTLLALEVVWFRLLELFAVSTALALTLMLAVVLLGISLGGFAASLWLERRRGRPGEPILPLSILAGAMVLASYTVFGWVVGENHRMAADAASTVHLAVPLVLPSCLISGALFTLLGQSLARHLGHDLRSTGLLTFANTIGAMVGALAGGFVLLPGLGTEVALLVLAFAYLGVASLTFMARPPRATQPALTRTAAAAMIGALILFPFGQMKKRFLPLTARRYSEPGLAIVETREGMTETIVYVAKFWRSIPLYYRMLTNGYSMSGTMTRSKRYMKLYVYWPIAVHPEIKRALLISFGVGQTARALADTKSLESIDVVDISSDIIEMRRIPFPTPEADPLRDPRVRLHIEDGRFFLLATPDRFDLITGEPPPPKAAGIVNLYTREYFQLVHDRLAPGGIATYWLPVEDLLVEDGQTITKAFCSAFPDCTMWGGYGLQWMLVGTNGTTAPTAEAFSRQWRDSVVGPEMRALGFEVPEQLGALFMGDREDLDRWTEGVPGLEDDHPHRLSPVVTPGTVEYLKRFTPLMETETARKSFMKSEVITRLWPAELRARSTSYFRWQGMINDIFLEQRFATGEPYTDRIRKLHEVLTQSDLRTLPLWILGTDVNEQTVTAAIAHRDGEDAEVRLWQGLGALAARDFERAKDLLAQVRGPGMPEHVDALWAYAAVRSGDLAEVRRWLEATKKRDPMAAAYASWLTETFRLEATFDVPAKETSVPDP